MYYIVWFVATMVACLFAVATGLWYERKNADKKD